MNNKKYEKENKYLRDYKKFVMDLDIFYPPIVSIRLAKRPSKSIHRP